MWAALQGSILLWGTMLAIYIGSMIWHFRNRRNDAVVGWATAVSFIVAAFFFGLMLGPADPFDATTGVVPADGPGPNPLLQNHPLMAFHPPVLYAGYVGFTIPFAFGVAMLITGRLGEGWLVEVRRWTLLAWGALGFGIVLGSWWSYEVLGWGGYWVWDPVENASLLPWLTATAYLHSVMVQERRGMLRVWNLSLLSATFALTILGTFLTRSGVLASVHAFSNSPLGPSLLTAFGVVVAVTCGLIFWRGDRLGSPGSVTSVISRESAFLLNNILFAAFAFVVLLGTVFPLLTEALNGDRISVGSPYFDTMTRPVGLLLLFMMAVAPFLTWKGASSQVVGDRLLIPAASAVLTLAVCVALGARGSWVVLGIGLGAFVAASSLRQLWLNVRRRGVRGLGGRIGGGMVAHFGFAIIAVALTVSQAYATRGEFQVRAGDSVHIAGHEITFVGLRNETHANRNATIADVRIDGGKVYSPALSTFPNSNDAIGTPSVRTSLVEDVYLTLVRTPGHTGDPATISVIVQPMVMWLWMGGVVIATGAVLALAGDRPKKQTSRTSVSVPQRKELVEV
jgi:cytochrome c-type biogenesis protein CcmF